MRNLTVFAAFLAAVMMAGFAGATPVNIQNANLDDNAFGFSQGVPSGWSSTGASWYGNGGVHHTSASQGTPGSAFDGSFYMNGNGFPGPNGGNLFQDVTTAVSSAVGGLVTGNSYTLTQCAYLRNANGGNINANIDIQLRQLSSGGPAATSVNQVYPVMTASYQLYSHAQSFTYLGGAIFFYVDSNTQNPNWDTFQLTVGDVSHLTDPGGGVIPEPSTFALLAFALAGFAYVGFGRRNRNRK